MADSGLNMITIDLGDGVRYESHPEIAVKNAWTVDRLRDELTRLRELGLEPLPKLNFGAGHDIWLGEYSRKVSSAEYYAVCHDLIQEVASLFDTPRFFHLGMDEETAHHQRNLDYVVIRQGNLWWHDLEFLADEVRSAGARPWVWSDPAWHKPGEFYARMPRDIVQSNWYYGLWFETSDAPRPRVLGGEWHHTYLDLEDHGFDQVPTGSTWHNAWENFPLTVEFCDRVISPDRLLGYLQAPWLMTVPEHLDEHLRTVDVVARAMTTRKMST